MKALKNIASVLFAFALCASMLAMPATALAAKASNVQTGTYVFDERGLFSADEFSALESKAADLAGKYNMGVYLLTTDYMNGLTSPSSEQRTEYATTYYKNHKLGLNPKDGKGYGDGIMLVIAADSRDYVTIAYGQGSYSFSDKGIEAMESAVKDQLADNKWYGGATAYYNQMASQLEYYDIHGKAQKPLGMIDYLIRIFIFVGIPLIITFFVINGWRRAMKTAVEQSEAGNYLDAASVNVTKANDVFVNTTMVVTPKAKDNDSGGGGWGGGGGGGFSSSGGGKF